MLKLSNTPSSIPSKGSIALKTYTPVGDLVTSTAAINGEYSLYTTFLATFPTGHGLTNFQSNVGSLSITVENVTQGYTERTSAPLQTFIVSGNSVFFRLGASSAESTYANLGLTNPSSGDTLKIRVSASLFGYKTTSSYKQTSLLS